MRRPNCILGKINFAGFAFLFAPYEYDSRYENMQHKHRVLFILSYLQISLNGECLLKLKRVFHFSLLFLCKK